MMDEHSENIYHITEKHLFDNLKSGIIVLNKQYYQQTEVIHDHEFNELVIVKSGSAQHITENFRYRVGRGDVFLLRSGMRHSYHDIDGLNIFNIVYSGKIARFLREDLLTHPGYLAFFEGIASISGDTENDRYRFPEEDLGRVLELLEEMRREDASPSPESHFAKIALFMRIVVFILRSRNPGTALPQSSNAKLREAVIFMYRNNSGQLKISDVAQACNVTIRTLQRLFKAYLNKTPEEYLSEIRLNRFIPQYLNSDGKIRDLAVRSGFSDIGQLNRRFKKRFGCSPREWRKQQLLLPSADAEP